MATYLELFSLVQSLPFRNRIQFALWDVAVEVLAAAGSTQPQKAFAKLKLRGAADTDELFRLAVQCATDDAIQAAGEAVADSEIRRVVAAAFAGLVA